MSHQQILSWEMWYSTRTKHDGCAVLFAVAELLVWIVLLLVCLHTTFQVCSFSPSGDIEGVPKFKNRLRDLGHAPSPPTFCIFTALHGMQMRSSDENSVRPSVCLLSAWIVRKWNKYQSIFLLAHDVINHAKFLLFRFKGFRAQVAEKLLSPIDCRYRPYNSVR